MPKFTVLCRVDAYVDYTAEVEAENADQAAELAREHSRDYKWTERGPVEFDARGYVTLNARGREVDRTRVGYFG